MNKTKKINKTNININKGNQIMVFGLGTKDKAKKESKVSKDAKSSNKKSAQGDEAAEILKKMEAKKDSGECAFC